VRIGSRSHKVLPLKLDLWLETLDSILQRRNTNHGVQWPLLMKAIPGALVLVLTVPNPALAWGSEGHRIVAEIAEQHLEPAVARQVRELLAIENATTLAQVSTWADEIRPQRRETAPWHFVDIPIRPPAGTPAAYDAVRDCPRGDCVVAAIGHFAAVLRDNSAPPRERL
jgi:S1/P1 Nuclease